MQAGFAVTATCTCELHVSCNAAENKSSIVVNVRVLYLLTCAVLLLLLLLREPKMATGPQQTNHTNQTNEPTNPRRSLTKLLCGWCGWCSVCMAVCSVCMAGVQCVHGGVHGSWKCPSISNTALPLGKRGGLNISTVQTFFQTFLFDMYDVRTGRFV